MVASGRLGASAEIPANLPVVLYVYREFTLRIKDFQAVAGN